MNARAYVQLIRGNREFRLLWLAQMVSEIGDWLYAVVLYDMLLTERAAPGRWLRRWSCRCCRKCWWP